MTPPPRRRWFGTLKARLMLASMLVIALSVTVSTLVVLDRLQGRSEQALMDLERDNAERAASLLAEVATGAREQTQGVAESARAVQELDQVTQRNAALVEQTAAAAGALQNQAHGLAEEVAQFKLAPA